MTYRARGLAFGLMVTSGCLFLALTIGAIATSSFFGMVLFGAFTVFSGLWASRQCNRVELHQDGTLVIHYIVRPNLTTLVRAVESIERDDEDGSWKVKCVSCTFEMRNNDTAAWMVHALVARRPGIPLRGYAVPPL